MNPIKIKTTVILLMMVSFIGCQQAAETKTVSLSSTAADTATKAPAGDTQTPEIVVSPELLKKCDRPQKLIEVPDSARQNTSLSIRGIEANLHWAGFIEAAEGDLEYFTFSFTQKTDTLFKVDKVLKAWMPEVTDNWATVFLRNDLNTALYPGSIFLVNTTNKETTVVDKEIFDGTNAPVIKIKDAYYLYYLKNGALCQYNLLKKEKRLLATLRLKEIDEDSIEPHRLDLKLNNSHLQIRITFSYNDSYSCLSYDTAAE